MPRLRLRVTEEVHQYLRPQIQGSIGNPVSWSSFNIDNTAMKWRAYLADSANRRKYFPFGHIVKNKLLFLGLHIGTTGPAVDFAILHNRRIQLFFDIFRTDVGHFAEEVPIIPMALSDRTQEYFLRLEIRLPPKNLEERLVTVKESDHVMIATKQRPNDDHKVVFEYYR